VSSTIDSVARWPKPDGTFEGLVDALVVMQTRCNGFGYPFAPLGQISDGLLDLVLCREGSLLSLVNLFQALKAGGGHIYAHGVFYSQLARIHIESVEEEEFRANIDGDVFVLTPMTVTTLRGAYTTFVPEK
jgi:diacylglycerol kinase family enzyme